MTKTAVSALQVLMILLIFVIGGKTILNSIEHQANTSACAQSVSCTSIFSS